MKTSMILILLSIAVYAQEQEAMVGGYTEIRVKDFMKENDEISNYILQALDEEAGEDYRLWKINHVYQQVVAGTNYKLIADYVSKTDHNAFKRLEIVVFDQPWTKTREIQSLNQLDMRVSIKTKQAHHYGEWRDVKKDEFLDQNKGFEEKLNQIVEQKTQNTSKIRDIVSIKEQFIAGRTFCLQFLMNDGSKFRAIIYHNPYTKSSDLVNLEKIDRFE